MLKFKKRVCYIVLAIIMLLEGGLPARSSISTAATTNNITVSDYIKLIVQTTKITVEDIGKNPYIEAALREGLIKNDEFSSYSAKITKEDAAFIANRVDELLHGTTYDEDLYHQIKSKKRLSDLSKVTNSKQDAVIKIFSKGIMIGSSNGRYTQSRKFNGKDYLSSSEAKIVVARVKTPSKRRTLSPDGQLIRTTKLPKNYKSYNYILEAFPNAFYEKKFKYQVTKYYYKPVELVNYASPARISAIKYFDKENGYLLKDVLDNHLDTWAKQIETNLKTRLNVDYRTIDNTWINTLRNTYYIYNDADMDKRRTKDIKEYVAMMKKNKVVVKGTVTVEPSTLYDTNGYFMRAYIKFKVDCTGNYDENFVYGGAYVKDLKKNQWNTMYVDIRIASSTGGSTGDDYAVYTDLLY